MTREDASFICANIDRTGFSDEMNDALDMAIEALENESKLESLNERYKHIPLAEDIYSARAIIERDYGNIESTEPKGHWIEHYNPEAEICMQHMSECSVCGKMICSRYNIYKNFCPNCGEKMEEQKTT